MLFLSRTPLRVSFFGGGTDYPEYFSRHRGAVVGMAINKYVHIAAVRLVNILDYKYRLSYSRIETVDQPQQIEHPVVREALKYYTVKDALDINIFADLPARTGLGSSSSFTVGFVNLLHALKGKTLTKLDLSRQATFVERELLQERVGVQDQLHASFGGINRFDFHDGRTHIRPIQMTNVCQEALTGSMFLVYTGLSRFASETLQQQMASTKEGKLDGELEHLLVLADQCVDVLEGEDPERMVRDFGAMMHDGWMTKKKLSPQVSNSRIDDIYEQCRGAGAIGGKLCGAGSGGFLLVVVPPGERLKFSETISGDRVVPIDVDTQGSIILQGER